MHPYGTPGSAKPRNCSIVCPAPVPTLALVPARRDQAGAGVPGGSGKTGSFLGLIDSKQLKTFLPLFSAGTYLSPETLM